MNLLLNPTMLAMGRCTILTSLGSGATLPAQAGLFQRRGGLAGRVQGSVMD